VPGQALQRARDKSSVTKNKHCVVVSEWAADRIIWRAVVWSKQKF